jgi:hypothetical protein
MYQWEQVMEIDSERTAAKQRLGVIQRMLILEEP